MIPLINESDSQVLEDIENLKNAIVYKDMLAFYDAYTSFYNLGIEKLPNYCVIDNKIYLNGMCLLIKDYSSEFGFETLDLTLEYLKVLYYLIAKFSKNGYFPLRSEIVEDFKHKKLTCSELMLKSIDNADKSKIIFDDAQNKFQQQEKIDSIKKARYKNMSLNITLCILIGLVASAIFIVLGLFKVLSLPLAIVFAVVTLAVFVGLTVLSFKRKNKLEQDIEKNKETTKLLKTNRDDFKSDLKKTVTKRDLLKLEIYNYLEMYQKIEKVAEPKIELLNKAVGQNMLSYNLKYDILESFEDHSKDILKTVDAINSLKINNNTNNALSELYLEIQKKDWLYYNNFVRESFIYKFIKSTGDTHIWQVKVGENYVNPFDINVKEIAEEKVAFLQDDNSLFVGMPVCRILKTNIYKQQKDLSFPKDIKPMELKNLRLNFSYKFYNYEEISKLKNVFYSNSDIKHSKVIDSEMIENKRLIPKLLSIRLQLTETKLQSENSNHKLIKEVNENTINPYEEQINDFYENQSKNADKVEEYENIDEYEEIPFDAMFDDGVEDIKEINEYKLEYTVNGKKVIGYKL